MNEMDLLTRMRDEIPSGPIPAGAQDALLRAIGAENDHERPARLRAGRRTTAGAGRAARPGQGSSSAWTGLRRPAIAAGLGVALAVGAITAAVVAFGGSRPAGSSGPAGAAAAAHARAAARAHTAVVVVADRAARAMLARSGFPPGQWVYFRELTVVQPGSKKNVSDGWETADGTTMATVSNGKVDKYGIAGTLQHIDAQAGLAPLSSITYQSLSSLPSDPHALVQYFENLFSSAPASQRPEKAFESIGQLLALYVTQPAFTAELYRAIADIPGVTVSTDAVNLAGQPTIALSYQTPTKLLGDEIFLDPHTYQYVGAATTVKSRYHNYGLQGYTVLRYALVSGPGAKP
jgi:hypothetical protein